MENIWFSLVVLSWKEGQKVEKLAVIEQVLSVLGQLLQIMWFCTLHWFLQRLWITVYFHTGYLTIAHLYIQSLKIVFLE